MVASALKLMFLIILPLQLSATLSQQHEHEISGVQMTLHMKMRMKSGSTNKISVEEPLYCPSDFVEYYIKLLVGTPVQDVMLVMDTGSDVCADPECRDLCENEGCVETFQKCSRIGTGYATGRLLSDTLTLPLEDGGRREIKNFAIGCSVASSQVAGIAGFGRGRLSMPSQLAPLLGDKFAYCLDYVNNSSKIMLGNKALPRNIPLTYTPLLINPVNPSVFSYFYLGLEAVSIGGKRLTLPFNLTTFDSRGNGGTIIDSGNSYTYFPDSIYNQIAGEFASQIGYRRAPGVEVNNGFGLCYNVSGLENIQLPKFAFHFKGGSDMVLPDENSFSAASSESTFCLAMQNSGTTFEGPAVSLGNFQQNNFYILHDKEKNRLGFINRACKTFG